MKFVEAFEAFEQGKAIARYIWGPNQYLVMVPGSQIRVEPDRPLGRALPQLIGRTIQYEPHIDVVRLRRGRNEFEPVIVTMCPYQVGPTADFMADDWYVVPQTSRVEPEVFDVPHPMWYPMHLHSDGTKHAHAVTTQGETPALRDHVGVDMVTYAQWRESNAT